jgi:hypothetical protein
MPNNVPKILITNAKVLIDRAPCASFSRFLLRHIIEHIVAIIPSTNQPRNILMIDHGNQSRILCISGDGTNSCIDGAGTGGYTLAV